MAPEEVKIEVLDTVCMGTRLCNAIAPDTFGFDETDDVTHPLRSPVPLDDRLREAADKCPVGAIVLRDAETGDELPY